MAVSPQNLKKEQRTNLQCFERNYQTWRSGQQFNFSDEGFRMSSIFRGCVRCVRINGNSRNQRWIKPKLSVEGFWKFHLGDEFSNFSVTWGTEITSGLLPVIAKVGFSWTFLFPQKKRRESTGC